MPTWLQALAPSPETRVMITDLVVDVIRWIRVQFADQGLNPGMCQGKCPVQTTGPPGSSPAALQEGGPHAAGAGHALEGLRQAAPVEGAKAGVLG